MGGRDVSSASIFLPSLRGGGAERIGLKLASGLAEQGFSVTVVVANAEGPLLADVPEAVRLIDLHSRSVLTSLPNLTLYLKRSRPRVMLSIMDHSGVVSLWAKKISGVKTKLVVSTRAPLSFTTQNPEWIGDRILPYLVHHSYGWADEIVAVSKGVADDLAETAHLPRNRIKVIYNPVVTPSLYEMSRKTTGHPWFDA